jgi:hypothetical protein
MVVSLGRTNYLPSSVVKLASWLAAGGLVGEEWYNKENWLG